MIIFLFLCSSTTYAMSTPANSNYDSRIKFTEYNSQDVVQLDGVVGIVTHIILEEDEKYVAHAFGDSEAWYFSSQDNHIFIKPKAEDGDTNLVLVTDRRSYNFRLRYHPSWHTNDKKGRVVLQDMTFQLAFKYPETEWKKQQEIVEKESIKTGLTIKDNRYNLNYTMMGDQDIAPINVWDDQNFTYFKFAGNKDIPAIYLVNQDGSESIVNRNTTGASNNVVVTHKVAKKWVLRLGDRSLGIYNQCFDQNGIENKTGTVSLAVERVVKKEGDDDRE